MAYLDGCDTANFNPRSREGSDGCLLAAVGLVDISIHAPVKGATRPCPWPNSPTGHFNPRSREGSDPKCPTTPPAPS